MTGEAMAPMTDHDIERLHTWQDRMEETIRRMDRGDIAHDMLIAQHGEKLDGIGRTIRDVRDEVAGMREEVRKKLETVGIPWWKDIKIIGVLALAVLGVGNGAYTVSNAAKDPSPLEVKVQPLPPEVAAALEKLGIKAPQSGG